MLRILAEGSDVVAWTSVVIPFVSLCLEAHWTSSCGWLPNRRLDLALLALALAVRFSARPSFRGRRLRLPSDTPSRSAPTCHN